MTLLGENPSITSLECTPTISEMKPILRIPTGIPGIPTSIPEGAYLWSDNAGIRGRFPSESLVGFFRNPWSDNVGIRIVHEEGDKYPLPKDIENPCLAGAFW
jgi:hypothetical protein